LKGHEDTVKAVAFNTDGAVLTGSDDGKILLWKADTGQRLAEIKTGGRVVAASFVFSNCLLAVSDSEGKRTARLWHLNPDEVAEARRPRDLTEEERSHFEVRPQEGR
jgi:WD40 repeat protein